MIGIPMAHYQLFIKSPTYSSIIAQITIVYHTFLKTVFKILQRLSVITGTKRTMEKGDK